MDEKVAPVTVSTHKPPVISPPLDGPNWLDGDSCCALSAHRGAVNALSGGLWAAERFAIDYVQLSPDGTMFTGDKTKPESYPYFGADIHAVADGPVVGVMDGSARTGRRRRAQPGCRSNSTAATTSCRTSATATTRFYAHLKTGSVKVKPGDQLTTGQVIGSLGNTGNSDAPHLHFHVMSTPDPLRSDGLPFVISSFRLDSRVASPDALDPLLQGKPAPMQPGFAARDETDVSPLVVRRDDL